MNRSLFITGATGFLGRRFLEMILPEEFPEVYCLHRDGRPVTEGSPAHGKAMVVRGDLLEPDRYLPALRNADVVIHMAAVTGKASREDYYRVNVEGTRRLVDACIASGVRKFLHVSTIAVNFPDDRTYHYACSKRDAESIVAGSGLSYAIVRPTIVLGKESPIWRNLSLLGRRSPVFLPGDGKARIQPIHVDDLLESLLEIIRRDRFPCDVRDLGGRDRLSIEDFIRKVHRAYHEKDPVVLHVPMFLILPPLRIAENAGLSFLPVRAGQFASFRYDGIVEENPLNRDRLMHLRGVDEIIRELAKGEGEGGCVAMERECEVFTRYLIGRSPDEYILRKYTEANRARDLSVTSANDRFGKRLLRVASMSPILTKLADSFSAVFAKRSLLRKKLVLLIAILESSRAAGELVGPIEGKGTVRTWISLFGNGIGFLAAFLFSLLLFAPLTILSKLGTSRPAR
jgi:nucleoside-diphosphate-sugar epimerase